MRTDLLIDQLADLAGQRTRDGHDACLLDLFHELLQPCELAVYRLSTAGGRQRWTVRRRMASSGSASLVQTLAPASFAALRLHRECWSTGQMGSATGPPALTVVPMRCQDETQCLVEIRGHAPIDADQLRLIEGAQRFHRQLQGLINENERDALTRLLNRKSFDESFLDMAIAPLMAAHDGARPQAPDRRCQRRTPSQRCWLAVADIDHFKRVNDTFGHLIGDEVLILVSQLLRKNFHTHDRLYRFGGEEFVVMLNTSRGDMAARALERLRQKIEGFTFPRVGNLTISIGFTEVKLGDTPSSAFERADECVYKAKHNGRNQIVAYESLASSIVVETPKPASEVEFF